MSYGPPVPGKEGSKVLPIIPGPLNVPPAGVPVNTTTSSFTQYSLLSPEKLAEGFSLITIVTLADPSHPFPSEISYETKPEYRKIEDSIPTMSLYRNGQIWKAGEYGNEIDLTHLKGYDFIRFLIENPDKDINVATVANLGAEGAELKDNEDVTSENRLEVIVGFSKQNIADDDAIASYKDAISKLKEEKALETDPEKRLLIDDEINKINKELNQAERTSGSGKQYWCHK